MPKGWTVGWFNATLKTVPGKSGHLYWTPGTLDEGAFPLYRSTDGGENWQALDVATEVTSFDFGKAATDGGYPTIYLQGKISGDPGIWRSTDEGANWEKIATYPLGIYDQINAIDGDKDVFGKVYMGFSGSGFTYGQPTSQSQQPTATPAPTNQATSAPTNAPTTTATAPVATTTATSAPTGQTIATLTLYNAATDQPIGELKNGATLDVKQLGTNQLSVVATINEELRRNPPPLE